MKIFQCIDFELNSGQIDSEFFFVHDFYGDIVLGNNVRTSFYFPKAPWKSKINLLYATDRFHWFLH